MKALSVCQPSSWAIVAGHKDIENRSWPTKFRGRLLIHATQEFDPEVADWMTRLRKIEIPDVVPHGAIIGSVEVYDCTQEHPLGPWSKRGAGGGLGMWHWRLREPRQFKEPIRMRGQLGLWEAGIGDQDE